MSVVGGEIGVDALALVGRGHRNAQIVLDHEIGKSGAIEDDNFVEQR
ncbi:MAG: hypothetical protein ACI83N_000845 [Hydrogenophaga sp.]|jgi:hypothetical protein